MGEGTGNESDFPGNSVALQSSPPLWGGVREGGVRLRESQGGCESLDIVALEQWLKITVQGPHKSTTFRCCGCNKYIYDSWGNPSAAHIH